MLFTQGVLLSLRPKLGALWSVLLLAGVASSQALAPPYLAVETSNGVICVTWTNDVELRLLESTNLENWVTSPQPFTNFGGHHRLRIDRAEARRFYRLQGPAVGETRLEWQSEFQRWFIRWPYLAEGFALQTRSLVHTGDWVNLNEPLEVVGGYRRFQVPDDGVTRYYRLSHPLNHVLIVGQSLAIGIGGSPILSPDQPYQNKMFVGQQLDGRPPLLPDDLSALVPLVERYDPEQGTGETIASGFANSVSFWAGLGNHDLLVSNCGRGASDYSLLKRGTYPYSRGTNQIAAGKFLAEALGYTFQAVFAVHGEADANNQHYDTDIRQWQSDLAEDMRSLTDQLTDPPMFHSQISWGGGFILSPFMVLSEYEANPTKTVLVGPRYFLPYSDGLHLNSVGYQWLGEYYAKAYHQHVVQGILWSPLRPIDISRSNEFITITFTGNVGDLQWDTNLVSDPQGTFYLPIVGPSIFAFVNPADDTISFTTAHQLQPGDPIYFHGQVAPEGLDLGAPGTRYYVHSVPQSNSITVGTSTNGTIAHFTTSGSNVLAYLPMLALVGPFGFEYMDDEGTGIPWRCSTEIESAEIISSNQVRLRLSRIPTGVNRRVRYAYLAPESALAGPTTGRRGCLRDSDPTPSRYGRTLYNWCVHFDKPIP